MRSTTARTFLLLLLIATAGGATAQEAPAKAAKHPRTWSEEMRDKAEISLYQRHDCREGLIQANAAFEREMRHPERMDPRIPLVKARAHECLAQWPQAVLAYAMHDRLSAVASSEDIALAGACSALMPDGKPEDPAQVAQLTDSLSVIRDGIERARSRNSRELFLRTGSNIEASLSGAPHYLHRTDSPMDQGTITRDMGNETIRVSQSAWYAPPYFSPRTGSERHSSERARDAESQLASLLADVEAQLFCLDPTR